MSAGILSSFLGAVQACLSVLLTICYGFVAGQIHLLDESSARRISRLSIKILLPALLVTNLGSELHLDTAMRYLPILGAYTRDI
jgi:predicted permease